MTDWRRRVAHIASPWDWGKPAFAVFVLAVVAVAVAALIQAATAPTSGLGKLIWGAIWAAGVTLLYLRPLARTLRRRQGPPG